MFRKLIAGAAVVGALTLGAAPLAGASTPNSTSSGSKTSAALASRCSGLPKLEKKVHTYDSKAGTFLPKAEASKVKAKAAAKTKLAVSLGKRIAQVKNHDRKLHALLAKAEAKCRTSGSSGSIGTTGSRAPGTTAG